MEGEYCRRYWGKADPAKKDAQEQWHPLVYHCLDVAACGFRLLQAQPIWLERISALSGYEPRTLTGWLTFLLAIHDIGKFGDGFQSLRPDLQAKLQGRTSQIAYDLRHDALGYALLMDSMRGWFGRDPTDDLELDLLLPWAAAVTGHHGRPPLNKSVKPIVLRHFPAEVRADARRFVQDVRGLLSVDWGLPDPGPEMAERQSRASWLVAGLAVASDWLGSNRRWFEFRPATLTPESYWHEVALPAADRAV